MSVLPKGILAASVALLLVTLWLLRSTGYGVLGEYTVEVSGAERRITNALDPQLFFPNDRRLRERLTSGWDLSRAPMPREFPPFTVRWSGTVNVPNGSLSARRWSDLLFPRSDSDRDLPRFNAIAKAKVQQLATQSALAQGTALTVATDAEYSLIVDGRVLESSDFREQPSQQTLAPGPHSFVLTMRHRGPPVALALAFYQREAGLVVVTGDQLAPPEGIEQPRGRQMATILLSFAALLCSAGLIRAFNPPKGRFRGQTLLFHLFAISVLTGLGAALRFHDYQLVPYFTETDDEFDIGWNGLQLLETGVPTGWFYTDGLYPNGIIEQWFNNRYYIVSPAFHRAPLMPLLAGATARIAGADRLFEVKLRDIRLPPIVLSLLTLGAVYVAALRMFGTNTALLATLLYATLPLIVVGSRLCKEENALTPLFVFALLAADESLRSAARRRWLCACGALSALAILAKQTGAAVPLAATLLLARRPVNAIRDCMVIAAICSAAVAAWVGYCLTIDAERYWAVMRYMGSLPGSFDVPLRILLEPRIVSSTFGQGCYQWLWIAFAFVALGERRTLWIPVCCYLLAIIATAQARFVFGWYLLPFYPFLCIGAGRFLEKSIHSPHVVAVGITALLAVLPALSLLLSRDVTEHIQLYRALLLILIMPPALWSLRPTAFSLKLARVQFATMLAILFASSVGISLNFFSIYSLR